MKKVLIVIVLLCFAGKADCRVTRKDVKAAHEKFIQDSNYIHIVNTDETLMRVNSENNNAVIEYFYTKKTCDSLYYEGLKTIRHDQKFWIIKR